MPTDARARPELRPDEDTLEPVETWPAERLRALQLERLRWTLRHVHAHVPYWRQAFADARVHPDDLETLADLARFPFTTARDLRDAGPLGLLAVPRERLARIAGGGAAVQAHTRRDLDVLALLAARSVRAAGVRPGSAVLVEGAMAGAPGLLDGIEKHGCAAVPAPDAAARWTAELEAAAVIAPAGGLASLAGLALFAPAALLWPAIGQECVETGDGATLWEDHFLPEIVDDGGRAAAEGELVLTSLTLEAMPLIRWSSGMRARLLPPTARGMRRVEVR